jgi:hypothetical protein
MGGKGDPVVIQAEQKAYEVFRGFKDSSDIGGTQWRVEDEGNSDKRRKKRMALTEWFKGLYCSTEMGHNVTTDDVKLTDTRGYRAMYLGKEREGKMPSNVHLPVRFAVGLLKSLKGENIDGKSRTFYELLTGYGKKGQSGYEPPCRLGDLPLDDMDRKAISGIFLPDYMAAGDESKGFDPFTFLMKPEKAPWEMLTTLDGIFTYWKKIQFCTPINIVFDGRLRDADVLSDGAREEKILQTQIDLFNTTLSSSRDFTTAFENQNKKDVGWGQSESMETQINRAIRLFRAELGLGDAIHELSFNGIKVVK